MIDPAVFADEWAVLCDRFDRKPSAELRRRYYRWLSDRLSTEDFRRGMERVLAEREFFPRPADFVEAVSPPKANAIDQLPAFRKVMSGSRGALEELDEAGRWAVEKMGGMGCLGRTKVDEEQWAEKRFLEFYDAARDRKEADQLPAITEQGKRLLRDAMDGKLDYLTRGETA